MAGAPGRAGRCHPAAGRLRAVLQVVRVGRRSEHGARSVQHVPGMQGPRGEDLEAHTNERENDMRLMTVTDSDIIDAIGFGDVRENPDGIPGVFGKLGVVFKSSPTVVYEYPDVSSDTYAKLVSGDSVGKTFHELFKKTRYPFTKSDRSTLAK